MIDEARRAGVTVLGMATFDAWLQALPRFRVVTLIAHWRPSEIAACDIQRLDALLEAAGDRESPLRQTLAGFDPLVDDPPADDVASLAAWLNRALAHEPDRPTALSREAALVEAEYRIYRRRQEIERILPRVFTGGPAVEFADGFRPVTGILRAVDPAMRTAVDLTICNSMLLAEEIRRKCRHALVMVNPAPASLMFRLGLYRQVIRLMKSGGQSYPNTMMHFRDHLHGGPGPAA